MKFSQSIKWRLQLWYGLILVAVLAGFGVTAYQLERSRQMRELTDELHKRIGILANSLHRPGQRPPGGGNNGPDGRRPGGPDHLNGPPDNQPFPGDGPPQFQRRPIVFRLSPDNASLFGTNDANNFYFKITRAVEGDRSVIAQSDNYRAPDSSAAADYDEYLKQLDRAEFARDKKPVPPKKIRSGQDQIVIEVLPSNEAIEVGCSLVSVRAELRQTALNLAGVGGLILLVGLAGGWWLVVRSLQPISEISATAAKISSGDLSQRINVAEAESELGQLAAVLNSTFARLETAFAQQKQFASDAAHELRTPVTVILTQTQMALTREREAASYRQTVEACQRAAQRMRKLIESLLELARFDAGQEVLKRVPFDLTGSVAESIEMVQPLANEKRVKLSSRLEPLEMNGDSERISQVVTNLLTNAIQYNQPDGEVRVKLNSENGLAVLEIFNTGKGISAEDRPRVFERFYRADKSRTGAGNSGLGLAICKAIVEGHGGIIEVSSELNIGTTFTVRLPS